MNKKTISLALTATITLAILLLPLTNAYETASYTPTNSTKIKDTTTITLNTCLPNARNTVKTTTGTLYTVYSEQNTTSERNSIYLATSTNNGKTWLTHTEIYKNTTYNASIPAMAIDSNDILHITWVMQNWTGGDHLDVYYTNSTDYDTVVNLPDQGGYEDSGLWNDNLPTIAVDIDDLVYVVWQSLNITWETINIRLSTSANWEDVHVFMGNKTPDEDTPDDENSALYPCITIDSTRNPYITYNVYNHTTDTYNVGCGAVNLADPGDTTTYNNSLGWNQSRNACVLWSNDTLWMSFKSYNSTDDNSNVTFLDCDASLENINRTELKTYDDASLSIYPSISWDGNTEYLVTATPTIIGDYSLLEYWVVNQTQTTSQNDTIIVGTAEILENYSIVTHNRHSTHNCPDRENGDITIMYYSGGLELLFDSIPDFADDTTAEKIGTMLDDLVGIIPVVIIIGVIILLLTTLGIEAKKEE